jgi:ureidoacrylate peracid hydrolase
MRKHYETTIERVRDYYGLVMDVESLKKGIDFLERVSRGKIKKVSDERISEFFEKHKLIDMRTLEKVRI